MASLLHVKNLFFDADGVKNQVDASIRRGMMRLGASTRLRAQRSIRKRKKSSPPGQPPSSHEGSLRRLIFFSYDPGSKSVVIGPVPFKQGEAPSLLEYGGTVVRLVRTSRVRGRKATPRQKAAFIRLAKAGRITRKELPVIERRTARYQGNPFMKPAGDAAGAAFRTQLREMVK